MRRAAVLLAIATLAACGGGDDDALAPFCDAYGELLVGPLADEATDATDPAVLEDAVATTEGLLADLVTDAPPELHGAATALAADYDATFAVLARYGYDLGRVQAEATAGEQAVLDDFGSADSDEFAAVQDWVADECAADVTLPPDLTTTTSP